MSLPLGGWRVVGTEVDLQLTRPLDTLRPTYYLWPAVVALIPPAVASKCTLFC